MKFGINDTINEEIKNVGVAHNIMPSKINYPHTIHIFKMKKNSTR